MEVPTTTTVFQPVPATSDTAVVRQQQPLPPLQDDEFNRLMDFLDLLWELMLVRMQELALRVPVTVWAHSIRRGVIGEHRNCVRALGTALPLRPYGRFFINHYSTQVWQSDVASDNAAEAASLNDVIDVLYTEQTPGVVTRTRTSDHQPITVPSCAGLLDVAATACYSPAGATQPAEPAPTDEQGARIELLEQELAKLRQQMLLMVQATEMQDTSTLRQSCVSPGSDSGVDEQPEPLACSSSSNGNRATLAKTAPPPPPPPPPPPVAHSTPRKLHIKRRPGRDENPAKIEHKASFADVLSELKVAKLRPTRSDRSPGGTPRRRSRRSQPSMDTADPGTFLMLALQKKFAQVHALAAEDSPTASDRLNLSGASNVWSDSSPDSSPTRKRLVL